jgi:Zn-finger nucleic acid-binding protein
MTKQPRNCPSCAVALAEARIPDGPLIDYCAECKGVWLDAGELAETVPECGWRGGPLNGDVLADGVCPVCNVALHKGWLLRDQPKLRTCVRCDGLWFEARRDLRELVKAVRAGAVVTGPATASEPGEETKQQQAGEEASAKRQALIRSLVVGLVLPLVFFSYDRITRLGAYRATEAEVLTIGKEVASQATVNGRTSYVYRPTMTFRYRVDGGEYESDTLYSPNVNLGLISSFNSSNTEYDRVLAKYKVGDRATAWFDPSRPKLAFLEDWIVADFGGILLSMFMIGVVLLGLTFFLALAAGGGSVVWHMPKEQRFQPKSLVIMFFGAFLVLPFIGQFTPVLIADPEMLLLLLAIVVESGTRKTQRLAAATAYVPLGFAYYGFITAAYGMSLGWAVFIFVVLIVPLSLVHEPLSRALEMLFASLIELGAKGES